MTAEEPLHVLVVEDDVAIGRLLQRGLTREGYVVDWARDLATAAEQFRTGAHRLVILDRMLPDGDGAALCSAIRKSGSAVPVCMLTAREALPDKLQGFDAGADDYVTKPFEFDELLARLAVMVRRSYGSPAERAALTVDEAARAIAVGRARAEFTPREWPLMRYLLDRPGEDVSRIRLIDEAWQTPGAVTENSVDVYIGYLRRKLADAGLPLRIETVRGLGFRLEQ